jgi:hypothetical protein
MQRKNPMNGKTLSILMTVLALPLFVAATAGAQAPPLRVDLAFNKAYYADKEPVRATVTVTSEASGEILITQGFSKKNFNLYIRITDPAGRFVASKVTKISADTDHAYGPLPFIVQGGRYVETAFCEAIPPGAKRISRAEDLRIYYDFSLPGQYVAEVLIPAAIYKKAPCDANDEAWQGVLRSKRQIITVEGSTKVKLSATLWPRSWRAEKGGVMNVKIWPQTGWTVDDYDPASIRLNNVPAARVEKASDGGTSVLLVTFRSSDVFESLGTVEAGKFYPVRITGKMRNTGEYFGGMRLVKVTGSRQAR